MGNRYTIRKLEQNETEVLDTFLYKKVGFEIIDENDNGVQSVTLADQ